MIYLRDTTEHVSSIVIDTPTGGLDKGQLVQIGSGPAYGFAYTTATTGSEAAQSDRDNYSPRVTIVTESRAVNYDKASGTGAPTFGVGDRIFVNLTTGLAENADTTGNVFVGIAAIAVTEGDSSLIGNFNGYLTV